MPDAKQVLDPRHPWYSYDDTARYGRCHDRSKSCDRSRSRDRRMPHLEEAEPDTTRVEVPESTDTEMYQALQSELLICSDYQAGLVRNATQAIEEVTGGDACCIQFREPAEEEEEEEVPRTFGTGDRTRGRSILKKTMANTAGVVTSTTPRQPHKTGDVPRGIGSPLDNFDIQTRERLQKTYNWYSQLKKSQSRSRMPSSRKREHQLAPKPPGGTPTQSPLQKSGHLQSVVTIVKKQPQDQGASRYSDDNVPAHWYSDQTLESTPYHLCGSPEDKAEPFVLYITDKFGWAEFQDEVDDFGNVFGHRTAFVACFCMATAVYFEITWVRGYHWVFPNIPSEMERMTSWRGVPLPSPPKESTKCNGIDLSERCLRRWRYFLALMQYWKDETTPFQYGGVVRYDSKVLLYCMFRIKAVLKTVNFHFHHYAMKSKTTWGKYASHSLTADQIIADRRAHQQTHNDLLQKKGWMQCRYEDEADLEFEVIKRVRGNINRVEVHHGERHRHPGNEDEYLRF